jgi:hypothetical protein
MHTVAYPTLEPKERVQGWGTRLVAVLPTVPKTNSREQSRLGQ